MGEEKKRLRVGSFATHSARGVIRDQRGRRKVMMVTLLVAVAMVLLGSTLLAELLDYRERPVWFILFWGVCAWITVTAILLAVLDLLMARRESRMERRKLREQVAPASNPDSPTKTRDG